MSIVTLAQAKQQLNIPPDDTREDDELQGYVDAVTGVVEDYKREVIEPREVSEDLDLRGLRRFRLWQVPLISLVSVTSLTSATMWDVSGMRPDADTGLVRVLSGPAPSGLVEVVYRAGYETVPARYVRGALVILQHTWETQRGKGPGPVRGGGGDANPRMFYSIPRKALEWLGAPRPVVG